MTIAKDKKAQEAAWSWRARKAKNAARKGKPARFIPYRSTIRDLSDAAVRSICKRGIPGYDPWRDRGSWGAYRFDCDLARRAIIFVEEELRLAKPPSAGQPFVLERWQRSIFGNLFGWVDQKGLRRYRQGLIYIPRKNGKSALTAALLLYLLIADDEDGAEIFGAASEYKQASLIFDHARGMVAANPELRELCRVLAGQSKSIQIDRGTHWPTYRVISSKDDSAHGFNVHAAVIDELHTQPDSKLLDALVTGTGARSQPLVLMVTTADYSRESCCNEQRDYAEQVRVGTIDDPTYLPVIYEVDPEADWRKPATWRKANPNLGVSVNQEYIEQACRRAVVSVAEENTFRRLHLNQRTEQCVRWLQLEQWDKCGGALDLDVLRGSRCYAGLDLANTTDIAALVLFFPDCGNAVLPFCWIPEKKIETARADRVPYEKWRKQGVIEVCRGECIDQEQIRNRINDLGAEYGFREIGCDPFQAWKIMTELRGDGFEITDVRQSFQSFSPACKELEMLVIREEIRHGGHPVLRWMAQNITVEIDSCGNFRPSRSNSASKIDAMVSLLMAMRLWIMARGSSVYEERGVLTI